MKKASNTLCTILNYIIFYISWKDKMHMQQVL
jgi:hypothetical protein